MLIVNQFVGFGGAVSSVSALPISNSVDLDSGDYFTEASPVMGDSDKTFALFGWFKFDTGGAEQKIFEFDDGAGANPMQFSVTSSDAIKVFLRDTSKTNKINWTTTATYSSGTWYHFLLVIDSTPATPVCKLWVDGSEVTSFTKTVDTLAQNNTFELGSSISRFVIGANVGGGEPFIGKLAQMGYQDGVAPSDASGHYDGGPVDVSGLTYGTGGGLWEFGNSDDLGAASQGSNDLTDTGTPTQSTDVPA